MNMSQQKLCFQEYWIYKIGTSFCRPPQILCVLLRKLAGSLPSLFAVRYRQTDAKTAFFDGKGFAAIPVVIQLTAFCGIFDGKIRQPLFEVCVVGADFHKVVCFCKINVGSLAAKFPNLFIQTTTSPRYTLRTRLE